MMKEEKKKRTRRYLRPFHVLAKCLSAAFYLRGRHNNVLLFIVKPRISVSLRRLRNAPVLMLLLLVGGGVTSWGIPDGDKNGLK